MHRLTKQVIYGLFYLIVFGLIILGVYYLFLKPAPTCFDGIQNQSEEGIDCGGPCAAGCLPGDIRPIDVGGVQVFSPNRTHISLLAKVQNYNTDYAAKGFHYDFKIYGKDGSVIGNFPGESFIYASEIKYLAVVRVNAPPVVVDRASLEISNPQWIKTDGFTRPDLTLQNRQISVGSQNIEITGRAFNDDTIDFSAVSIIAVLIGQFNQPVGVSRTEISNLSPNEARSFIIHHPFVPGVNPDATKILFYALRP